MSRRREFAALGKVADELDRAGVVPWADTRPGLKNDADPHHRHSGTLPRWG
jgi:hypothetical protein